MKEQTIKRDELAELCGLTPRRISQLVKEEVLVTTGRGQYPAFENWRRYSRYMADQAQGKGKDSASENTRLTKEKADLVALQVRELQGKLIRVETVIALLSGATTVARATFLSVPAQLLKKFEECIVTKEGVTIDRAKIREAEMSGTALVNEGLQALADMSQDDIFEQYNEGFEDDDIEPEKDDNPASSEEE